MMSEMKMSVEELEDFKKKLSVEMSYDKKHKNYMCVNCGWRINLTDRRYKNLNSFKIIQ